MKEPQWDDSADDSKEFFDATEILSDEDTDDEEPVTPVSAKSQFTDLRRRIEERLDSKRIDHEFDYDEFDYDDFDGLLDSLN
ncbi:MAG: hypothetical protein DHS20C12_12310 [Pseudohongiella sp.]|nr:MAG: hypothetical protein DHS20C12_12310 [Pseudohongiella sp.]